MLGGAEWFTQPSRGIFADGQQPDGQARTSCRAKTFQPLADRHGDGCRLTLAGQLREFHDEMVRLLVLDVEAHDSTFLPPVDVMVPRLAAKVQRGAVGMCASLGFRGVVGGAQGANQDTVSLWHAS